MKTPNGAVPRTGRAEYGVDLIGVEAFSDTVAGVTGRGTMQVDFATGAVVTAGTFDANDGPPSSSRDLFSSEARLAATATPFPGPSASSASIPFLERSTARSTVRRRRRSAQLSPRTTGYSSLAGVLIGRGAGVTAVNSTVTQPTVNEFFTNDAGRAAVTITGRSGQNVTAGTFSNGAAAPSALVVNYNAALNSYSLIGPDGSKISRFDSNGNDQTFSPQNGQLSFKSNRFDSTPGGTRPVTNAGLLEGLQYVRAARWLLDPGTGATTSYAFNDFTYGVSTAGSAVPRTGTGGFVIGVRGTAADGDFPNLVNFSGTGTATVNFATGAMTGSGALDFREDFSLSGRATRTATGEFTISAALAGAATASPARSASTASASTRGRWPAASTVPRRRNWAARSPAPTAAAGVAVGTLVGRNDPSLTSEVPARRRAGGHADPGEPVRQSVQRQHAGRACRL
jgi:hypothetical protein